MDYGSEILNISKIKDSFFIGDKVAGTNLDVLIQFKISHIINAAGNHIMNYFESIGIQYYTLFWSENPNQNLFDQNDEIVDKILLFIKDSFIKGEGLLIHSVKGKDRCCIVVIIYLMKKYYWSVNKCIDFLKSKKEDIEIESYFLQQLLSYEMRLSKISNIKTANWNEITFKDGDEKLLRNTYVNGLPVNKLKSVGISEIDNNINKENIGSLIKKNNIHIKWANEEELINLNFEKELLFLKEIKPITCHTTIKPLKSSIKKIKENCSLLQSLNNKKNLNNEINNLGNQIKKKLKIRADVDINKISSEYINISPNIIKQLIENDNFYFFCTPKNNSNNIINSLNSDKNNKKQNNKKRPLSYDNKNNNKNRIDLLKDCKNICNEQIYCKSYSLNKSGNTYKKGIYTKDVMNNYFSNDQNKIKKLFENNHDNNKLLKSLNNQNKMNVLINSFTYLNNNNINGNSQFKKLYDNYPNKNLVNDSISNNLSFPLKKSIQNNTNNQKKSKQIFFKLIFLIFYKYRIFLCNK